MISLITTNIDPVQQTLTRGSASGRPPSAWNIPTNNESHAKTPGRMAMLRIPRLDLSKGHSGRRVMFDLATGRANHLNYHHDIWCFENHNWEVLWRTRSMQTGACPQTQSTRTGRDAAAWCPAVHTNYVTVLSSKSSYMCTTQPTTLENNITIYAWTVCRPNRRSSGALTQSDVTDPYTSSPSHSPHQIHNPLRRISGRAGSRAKLHILSKPKPSPKFSDWRVMEFTYETLPVGRRWSSRRTPCWMPTHTSPSL